MQALSACREASATDDKITTWEHAEVQTTNTHRSEGRLARTLVG
jgi:hypothetical protein